MAGRIAVGGEDFIALRKADSYYVDKTELIYDLVQNANNIVTLFTRPRRFGKTLTMSMLESFFRIDKKSESNAFNGLNTVDPSEIVNLMNALWNGDEKTATGILSSLLWRTIRYNDYKEDYYHAFLAGIFVGRGGYSVQSNKEEGLGRPDIEIRDKANRRAIIVEAKISESKKRMEYWCDDAIGQIKKNGYARELEGYRDIKCYGIAFYKKTALVKIMQ